MNIKVFIKTFGCKVNQYDSELIKENLSLDKNFTFVNDYKKADLFIINSCYVTESAEEEVLKYAKRFSKLGKVIITGCFKGDLKIENTYLLDLKNELNIRKFIYNLYNFDLKESLVKDRVDRFSNRTRAFVKIEEGCNKFCSYCIVPYLRGRARSREIKDVIEEIKNLIQNGYKEIVLTGTELGYFGFERGENLTTLLYEIIDIKGDFRVRLSSIDPEFFTDEIINIMKKNNKICPHIHLPLQSGSDKILEKMRRRYNLDFYLDRVQKFKENVKNGTITTDIIVGFPYEEDEDFEKTIITIEKVKFLKCHIFPYSKREQTYSSGFDYTIKKEVLDMRLRLIREVSNRVRREVVESFNNKELIILTESKKGDRLSGFTENYIRVYIDGEYKENNFYKIYLQTTKNNVEYGIVLNEFHYSIIEGGEIKECPQYTEEKVKT